MPPFRKKDKHLPANVYYTDYSALRVKSKRPKTFKHAGAYIFKPYIVIDGKRIRKTITLGHTYPIAMAKWIELTDKDLAVNSSMQTIFDRYLIEIAPKKSEATYKQNIKEISNLRTYFGDMNIEDIEPTHIYRYLDIRGENAPVGANREIACFSHIMTKCIRWGLIRQNPCTRVERNKEKPRIRYVQDWEFIAIRNYSKSSPIIRTLMALMFVGGRRRCELLNINKAKDVREEGIEMYDPKGKERFILEWSDDLRLAYQEAIKIRRKVSSIYLLATHKGRPYTGQGLRSMFYRIIQNAIKDGVIEEPFTLHDIRAKASSDEKDVRAACDLLKHTSTQVTDKHYRRKIKRIKAKNNTIVVQINGDSTNIVKKENIK